MSTAAAALAKKRVRRQKQIIVVGSVVLLALLGYQLPKLLGGKENETFAPAPLTTSSSTPSLAAASPVAAGALPDTDRIAVQRDTSQLVSFGLFKSKDPFVQQLSDGSGAAVPTPASVPSTPVNQQQAKAKTAAAVGATTGPSTEPPLPSVITEPAPGSGSTAPVIPPTSLPGAPSSTTTTPASAPPAAPAGALISTNDVCEQVALNGTFPANEDIFRLVEIAKNGKSAKIGIVGGSYDSGQATAVLKLGEKLTLVNTADGSRYVIALQAKCDVVAPASPAPTTTTATTTPAPTPTVTSPAAAPAVPATPPAPIVTDSLDTPPTPSS
jgi:hypothetical protein